jgi:hypothetical protein
MAAGETLLLHKLLNLLISSTLYGASMEILGIESEKCIDLSISNLYSPFLTILESLEEHIIVAILSTFSRGFPILVLVKTPDLYSWPILSLFPA